MGGLGAAARLPTDGRGQRQSRRKREKEVRGVRSSGGHQSCGGDRGRGQTAFSGDGESRGRGKQRSSRVGGGRSRGGGRGGESGGNFERQDCGNGARGGSPIGAGAVIPDADTGGGSVVDCARARVVAGGFGKGSVSPVLPTREGGARGRTGPTEPDFRGGGRVGELVLGSREIGG